MKKNISLLILLLSLFSYSQDKPIIIQMNPADRQKIGFDTITGDISLQNSPPINIKGFVQANSAPLVQENASTKNLTKEDAWKVFRNRSVSNEEFIYTIPNQTNGGFTEDIGYTFYTKDNGKIFVKGQTGSGVEPVEISGAGQYATITRFGDNNWDWSKGVLPWVPPYDPFVDSNFVAGFWAEDLGEDESLVETWADRTGNNNNATQSILTNRPKVNVESDGKKAVDFDGVNDGLEIINNLSLTMNPGDPISLVMVTGRKSFPTGSNQFLLHKGNTTSSVTGVQYGFQVDNVGNTIRGKLYGSQNSSDIARTVDSIDVWIITSNGTTAIFYKNGIQQSTWSVGSATIDSNIWIGCRLGTQLYFEGSIRAIGISNIELSTGQMDVINNFEW